MTEAEFFDDSWIGQTIHFNGPKSSWVLREKLSDKNDKQDMYEFREMGTYSSAYGTFRCEDTSNASRRAIMKIIMQIPYHGSEYAIATERARQAGLLPSTHGQGLLNVTWTLSTVGCTASPGLLNKRHATQNSSGAVPGGYIIFVLVEHLPGIQMGPWFWDKDRATRDRIREATREAWKECVPHRWVPWPTHDCLFWDEASNKVYFHKFVSYRDHDLPGWLDIEWIRFGQAENLGPPLKFEWAATGPYDTLKWRM